MNRFNETPSDSSEHYDSELEFELYSQVHYRLDDSVCDLNVSKVSDPHIDSSNASGCSSDVADWELLTSSSSDEDETDRSFRCRENRTKLDSADLWKISTKDLERTKQQIIRYYNKPRERCKRCMKFGHSVDDCRKPKPIRKCFLCAQRSHVFRDCYSSTGLGNCHNEKKNCKRCHQTGHTKKHCPDLWRQFHLTVKPGPIVTAKTPTVTKKHCHVCTGEGHLPHKCKKRWDFPDSVFNAPTISKYDNIYLKPKTVSQKKKRIFKVAKKKNIDFSIQDPTTFDTTKPCWSGFNFKTSESKLKAASEKPNRKEKMGCGKKVKIDKVLIQMTPKLLKESSTKNVQNQMIQGPTTRESHEKVVGLNTRHAKIKKKTYKSNTSGLHLGVTEIPVMAHSCCKPNCPEINVNTKLVEEKASNDGNALKKVKKRVKLKRLAYKQKGITNNPVPAKSLQIQPIDFANSLLQTTSKMLINQ